MNKQKCERCSLIQEDFNDHHYLDFMRNMKELVMNGQISLIKGTCPLNKLGEHIEKEDLYILEHYFQCDCGKYIYIGLFIRGKTIIKFIDAIPHQKE